MVVKLMINMFPQAAESAVSFSIHLIVGFLDIQHTRAQLLSRVRLSATLWTVA